MDYIVNKGRGIDIMKQLKAIRITALIAALFGVWGVPSSARADDDHHSDSISRSGRSTVTVGMPEYLVLHYYSAVALNLSATSSGVSQSGSVLSATWTTLGDTSQILAASATEVGPLSVNVTLKNAWAIAGLSKSGTATVSITGTDFSATRTGSTSKIGVTGYTLSSTNGVSGAVSGSTITMKLRGVTGQTSSVGDVRMNLNFMDTTESGDHVGSFTITAQTI
ncbi:hypothetical protein [Chlorobium ferrooxidans]|uniref:Uncharacterized protein n=1 Tax=Chlorobium ferrooxidans DSM 13031 TaxID=377431 RepID=Q0YTI9_9CHLB|nr:hypothetical protein [Chlorobium ferrooxidans]EAT59564.1 hypothetical protein CferDRAFT_1571 [Chlorobium ferrooxidans DSM 13031]